MKRGEIWHIDISSRSGAETHTTRPGIIVSVNAVESLPVRVIVPVTEWKDRYSIASWMVRLQPNEQNQLSSEGCADTLQVQIVSTKRFVHQLGKISDEKTKEIEEALANVLGISH